MPQQQMEQRMGRRLFYGQIAKTDLFEDVSRVEQSLDVVWGQRRILIGLDQRPVQRRDWSGEGGMRQPRTPRDTQCLQRCCGQSFLCGPPRRERIAFTREQRLSGGDRSLKSGLFLLLFLDESITQSFLLLPELGFLRRC